MEPNVVTKIGWSALHATAAGSGNVETARLLLDAGADPNQRLTDIDAIGSVGQNAVYMAIQRGYMEVAQLLADRGADLDIWTAAALGRTQRLDEIAKDKPWLIHARGRYKLAPIHFAATWAQPDSVRVLIRRGAHPDATEGRSDSTALHIAAARGHVEVVKVLLELGADPEEEDAKGETPLDKVKRRPGEKPGDRRESASERQAIVELLQAH